MQTRVSSASYLQLNMIIMAALGFASGLPLLLTASTLAVRLSQEDIRIQTIGLFSLVGLPYVLKFLWAPFLDSICLPVITRLLGRRRGVLLLIQLLLMVSVAALGVVSVHTLWTLALLAVWVSFLSASQDIVIDALRIETIPEVEQATALAMFSSAYRLAMVLSFTGAILLAEHTHSWPFAYAIMAACLSVGMLATFMVGEETKTESISTPFRKRLQQAGFEPLRAFIQRPGWLYILAFIILYKLGDIFTGHMMVPFIAYKGYGYREYALLGTTCGLTFALLGNFCADRLVRSRGLYAAVLIGSIGQNVVNIVFTFVDILPRASWVLGLALSAENFFWSMGTVVFGTWLSQLCRNRAFTATEFALLTAISAVGRTIFPSSAGYFVGWVGYAWFFALTALFSLPSLYLFIRIERGRQ